MGKPQQWEVWNDKGQRRGLFCTRRELSAMCKASNPAWRRLRWLVRRIPHVGFFMDDRHERGGMYREWRRQRREEDT